MLNSIPVINVGKLTEILEENQYHFERVVQDAPTR
mgnify:FL=1